MSERSPSRLFRLMAALGLLLHFALWLALATGAVRLMRLGLAVATRGDEAAAPERIREEADVALLFITTGQVLALSGLGLLLVALTLGRVRARWVFWGGIAALAAWFPFAPYGTLLALAGITGFVLARSHFLGTATPR